VNSVVEPNKSVALQEISTIKVFKFMRYNNLTIEVEQAVATITLNRPKALNALNVDTLLDLQDAFEKLEKDAAVKVLILTGKGEKAFCAGGDIAHMRSLDPQGARDFVKLGQKVLNSVEKINKPVIAAVNGYALGGGSELALSCDIRLASSNARFALPEVGLGIIPSFGGTQRLPRLIGTGFAKELIFTGAQIDAKEACRIGLVNRVVEQEDLLKVSLTLAQRIASQGTDAIGFAKDSINNGTEMDLEKGLAYEADLFALCYTTGEQVEGMSAFLEKRQADFSSIRGKE
jgi:enoyl-CoA hydratase